MTIGVGVEINFYFTNKKKIVKQEYLGTTLDNKINSIKKSYCC